MGSHKCPVADCSGVPGYIVPNELGMWCREHAVSQRLRKRLPSDRDLKEALARNGLRNPTPGMVRALRLSGVLFLRAAAESLQGGGVNVPAIHRVATEIDAAGGRET